MGSRHIIKVFSVRQGIVCHGSETGLQVGVVVTVAKRAPHDDGDDGTWSKHLVNAHLSKYGTC